MQDGTYFGYRTGAAVSSVGKNNTPAMVITFNVTHTLEGTDWVALSQAVDVKVFIFLSDAAFDMAIDKLNSLGFKGNFQDIAFDEEADKKGIQLTCVNEVYNGKTREKWELANWGSRDAEPVADDMLRTLNARFKAKTQTATKPTGKPAMPPAGKPANGQAANKAAKPAPAMTAAAASEGP